MSPYSADNFLTSGSKVWEHWSRIAEFEMELTIHGAFLRTVHQGVVNRLALDDMTRVCSDDDVVIRVFRESVR